MPESVLLLDFLPCLEIYVDLEFWFSCFKSSFWSFDQYKVCPIVIVGVQIIWSLGLDIVLQNDIFCSL
jgi:hypothetical protein